MHMADALISPGVGAAMTAASLGLLGLAVKRLKTDDDEKKIPLMGVMGAFVFAAQMINFTIPATGSSGHIGGGLLLAAILGPCAGFVTIASVLVVQALFFADGGLLALGCNIFNMGFFPCFFAYPLIYRSFVRRGATAKRVFWGSLIGVVTALQLGAFSVVLETMLSGRTELDFASFTLLMLPIHLAIGCAEGIVTAGVVSFIHRANPSLADGASAMPAGSYGSSRNLLTAMLLCSLLTGGLLSLYASEDPDGLEWSLIAMTGSAELPGGGAIHQSLSALQEKTALLPDYAWPEAKADGGGTGTSAAGIIGGILTLVLVAAVGKLTAVGKKLWGINKV